MRGLHLTSPEMRGPDVRALQHILCDRLAHFGNHTHLAEDGVYGRATAQAVATVAWDMGLEHYTGTEPVLMLIEHPSLREPAQIHREHQRAKARSEHHGGSLEAIVQNALKYVGTVEHPPESNWGEPNPADWERHFGFSSGVSWCGCFAGSMVLLAGGHVDSRVAFCPYIEADARSKTNGFDLWRNNHSEGVEPGWLVLYNWTGGSEPEHVGVVKEILSDHLIAVEGNTGGTDPAAGGMVAVESRTYNFTVGYARPRL